MMNVVCLNGRMVKDAELCQSSSGYYYTRFSIAVQKSYDKDQCDFINCVAWTTSAEYICKYCKKGSLLAINGSLQSNSWTDNNGVNRYETIVSVDNVGSLSNKTNTSPDTTKAKKKEKPKKEEKKETKADLFKVDEEDDDEDLPF